MCNYLYFCSLAHGVPCVFVHVPPVEKVPLEAQVETLARLRGYLVEAVGSGVDVLADVAAAANGAGVLDQLVALGIDPERAAFAISAGATSVEQAMELLFAEEPPAPPPFVWRRSFGEMMEAVAPPTAGPLPVGPPTDEELAWLDAQMSKAYEAGKAYAAAAPSPAAEYYEPIPAGFEPLGAAQVQSALRSARKTYGAKQSAIRNAQSAVRRIGSGAEIRAAPPAAAPAPAPPRPTLSRGQSSWIDPSSGELLTRL